MDLGTASRAAALAACSASPGSGLASDHVFMNGACGASTGREHDSTTIMNMGYMNVAIHNIMRICYMHAWRASGSIYGT
jgi:hypothetical protein